MKKLLFAAMLISAFQSHAQVFWTETFSNGCTSGCHASSYSGANGAWTVTSMGANIGSSNIWFVSAIECGNAAGQCGTSCGSSDPSLHVGANIVPFLIDPGAAYYANIESYWRAESPTINCSGKSNIMVSFNYIQEAQPGSDFAALAYYDGTSWYYYETSVSSWTTTFTALPITGNASCAPQGLWTANSVMLPASANNNPSVKIGFRWVNNNDGLGTDPSFAVDDINISASAGGCSVSINPIFPAILCYGDCNSTLGSTASGVGFITYQWSTVPPQLTPTASNLCAGTYSVTITDSAGCTATASMTITQPPLINIAIFGNSFNGWGEPCNGDCLDTLTIAIAGGTSPYGFTWSNGCITQVCPNNCAGVYTVTATDANGCTASASYVVTEPPVLTMGAPIITNPSCNGCSDGSICLGAHSGGTPSYTYSITPNAGNFNGNCWQNLPAGIYTVCITDANGCTVCATDTVVDPPSGISNNFSQGEIILSPNIISTYAVLTIPFEKEFSFTVYDCFGKKVREEIFSGKQILVERENLSSGLYFFRLTANQRRFYTGKFVVE